MTAEIRRREVHRELAVREYSRRINSLARVPGLVVVVIVLYG
jgi:hypothetical protein